MREICGTEKGNFDIQFRDELCCTVFLLRVLAAFLSTHMGIGIPSRLPGVLEGGDHGFPENSLGTLR